MGYVYDGEGNYYWDDEARDEQEQEPISTGYEQPQQESYQEQGSSQQPELSPPQSPDERRDSITDMIQGWYQESLGRPMGADELATEYANYEKYGGESIRNNLSERSEDGSDQNTPSQRQPSGFPAFNFPQQNTAYSDMVMRLMQQQEARMASDAQRRQAFEDQFRASLMDLIRRGQEPVDANSISQSQEAKAFARVRERQLQKFRAKMAEQRGAQGLGQNFSGELGGAFGSDIQGGESQLREQIAAFESKMVADQINRRRQELMQALSMGAGMLSSEQSNAIRSELAQLDAALQREQFHADLGLREFLGGGQLSLGMLGAMNQNQQFYDRLGYDYDNSQSDLMYRILYGG